LFKHLDFPPLWALATASSAWAFAVMFPLVRFNLPVIPWLVAGLGLALILWSAVHFRRNHTPIEPRRKPAALLVAGPYRINRNPIYTGMTLILAGWALGLGALTAFIPVLAFPALITQRFIEGEERMLLETFGESARAYLDATRRW
jgi:protein-S-isoprenylcysteine O-methyltransferase Ste14